PRADANTEEPPDHVFERRAVEDVEEVERMQLPDALDPPEVGVIDGADGRRRRADRFEATLDQGVIDRGHDSAEREERRHDRVGKDAVEQFDRGQVEHRYEEHAKPPREQEYAVALKMEPLLRGQT